jgi:alkylation response protein AidB-like acyl-CoA dehydrogenase
MAGARCASLEAPGFRVAIRIDEVAARNKGSLQQGSLGRGPLRARSGQVYRRTCQPVPVGFSMAKLFATEAANRVAYQAVQMHGGYGDMCEPPVERFFEIIARRLLS